MKLRDCVAHRINDDGRAAEGVCADRYRELRAGTRISTSLYIELHTSSPCRLTGHRDTTCVSRVHYALAIRPAFLPGRSPLPFDRCVTVYKLQNNVVKGNRATGFCPRKMRVARAFCPHHSSRSFREMDCSPIYLRHVSESIFKRCGSIQSGTVNHVKFLLLVTHLPSQRLELVKMRCINAIFLNATSRWAFPFSRDELNSQYPFIIFLSCYVSVSNI